MTGDPGTALAYAYVSGTGNVDEAESKGISDADISRDSTGVYCMDDLPPGAKSVMAVAANPTGIEPLSAAARVASVDIEAGGGDYTGCAVGDEEVRVTTFDLDATSVDNGFFIWFED